MNKGFYIKMAGSNIKNNRNLYFPYVIMSAFVIMMMFMIESIIHNTGIKTMSHGDNVIMLISIALWVVRIFSVIFIFYINSFLIKRRKKELGLYNVLGMGKRHIAVMMFWENVIVSLVSMVLGILFGIVFNRISFLLLFKLINVGNLPKFEISVDAIIPTVVLFAVIYFLTYLFNVIKVGRTNTINLLHGGMIGEKEPKTKILLTIIGVITMGGGYYFALTVDSPFKAINLFLLAVIAVVIGTYALFTAGSIAIIKLLRKNKNFYYKAKNFSALSGMLYRMKQNAVGLASICILSTMALISVATTFSMYASMEDTLNRTYPNEVNIVAMVREAGDIDRVNEYITKMNKEHNVGEKDFAIINNMVTYGKSTDDNVFSAGNMKDFQALYDSQGKMLGVIPLADFNKANGTDYSLNDGEILVYSSDNSIGNELRIDGISGSKTFTVAGKIKKSEMSDKMGINTTESIMGCLLVIVKDYDEMFELQTLVSEKGSPVAIQHSITYDTQLKESDSKAFTQLLRDEKPEKMALSIDNRYDIRYEIHQMYGCFLFIGLFFGILFLAATTIIIYYKQISEGYDDRERYIIMQKVGMSYAEVKRSISSQVLMVFFLPLIVAGLHVAASFRIVKMILNMLSFGNTNLFLQCTLGTFLGFTVIYALVFMLTAKVYYKIVAMKK